MSFKISRNTPETITTVLLFCSLVISCNRPTAEDEIRAQIDKLYSGASDVYAPEIDSSLFSKDLVGHLHLVRQTTERDRARILDSEHPTDKPLLLEGAVFSSLYDGYSRFSVREVHIRGTKAEAIVEFQYDSEPVEIWTDRVALVREERWLIDNVVFLGEQAQHHDLLEKLRALSALGRETPP